MAEFEKIYELTCKAVLLNELDKLLLGEFSYGFKDKFSPTDGPTDITVIWQRGILEYATKHPNENFDRELVRSFDKLLNHNKGIVAVASIVLLQSYQIHRNGASPLSLPLEELADTLRDVIRIQNESLRRDRSGEGALYKDGMLGELRRLSQNTVSQFGPAFFPPELNQEKQPPHPDQLRLDEFSNWQIKVVQTESNTFHATGQDEVGRRFETTANDFPELIEKCNVCIQKLNERPY